MSQSWSCRCTTFSRLGKGDPGDIKPHNVETCHDLLPLSWLAVTAHDARPISVGTAHAVG